MSRDFKLSLLILLPLVGAVILYLPHSPGGTQRANMARARAHLPAVQEQLDGDERFREVQLGVYTGKDGCVWVLGNVRTEADLRELRRLVEATDPPVAVQWSVHIDRAPLP